jgi:hypothetical protein
MTKAFLDSHHPRLLCECCELPTRAVPMIPPAIPDYKYTTVSCPLCEWENAPVDRHGETVLDTIAAATERNGGHTLAEAQSNFRQFLSMYDPAKLEAWMPEPPTAEERQWKEELVRQYKIILDPFALDSHGTLNRILELERALEAAAQTRAEARSEQADPDAPDDDAPDGDDPDNEVDLTDDSDASTPPPA